MNIFKRIISSVVHFVTSGKAEKALNQAAELAPKLLWVVKAIAEMTPNRTDDEIVAAYEKYGLPAAQAVLNLPPERKGLALLTIATDVAAVMFPSVPTKVLQTAIQLAVTASL